MRYWELADEAVRMGDDLDNLLAEVEGVLRRCGETALAERVHETMGLAGVPHD